MTKLKKTFKDIERNDKIYFWLRKCPGSPALPEYGLKATPYLPAKKVVGVAKEFIAANTEGFSVDAWLVLWTRDKIMMLVTETDFIGFYK